MSAAESPLIRCGFEHSSAAVKSWLSEPLVNPLESSTSCLDEALAAIRDTVETSLQGMEREFASWMELVKREEDSRIKEKQTKEVVNILFFD